MKDGVVVLIWPDHRRVSLATPAIIHRALAMNACLLAVRLLSASFAKAYSLGRLRLADESSAVTTRTWSRRYTAPFADELMLRHQRA